MLTPKKKSKKGTSAMNYGYEAGKLAGGVPGAMAGAMAGKALKSPAGATAGKKMKTGGMINANKSVTASKAAKGRSGGTSKAPKTAIPKAMYGTSMRPGMMKKGGAKKMK